MAEVPLSRLALRSLLTGLAIGAVGIMAVSQSGAQALGGHNTDAPVSYQADRMELQDRQDRVVLAGNVRISQGNLSLTAERTTVAFTDTGSLQIQRIDATGGVNVTRGSESARGDVAIYDFNRRVITLAGNVALRRGGDTLNGGRLVIDLNSGVSSVDGRGGGAGGRVSGTFSVPKRN
ncbi:LptA/OstA family protein [Novosphingobium sp.]|jgi:lipopolysaccharide export system protein LptA|uniref:LptA/OstA family protein n=1 Tax=Novosphingobium sp. TaxID=1874826 RepID=UPI0022CB928E|nr:LptA/OstA family protein [Novosphingobium sp.]MCZ8018779.1 OstA family protein [Novosphingobium sp.]MCZ8034784.1 OstA family protein [Novosphingobium sp.]MCZ8052919.1 OstA family protein [Novosphingobium sp.]MCZ8060677.1 OstA family protein [Novosphingobium sp.]MCZ8230703.1 OstA family protein [Novosphingobium sp.]